MAFVRDEGIDPSWRRPGTLDIATEPYQVDDLRESVELAARYGEPLQFLDRDAIQAEVHSPRFLAGVRCRAPSGRVMVNPAKLAWGLADAAERRGAGSCRGLAGPRARRRAGRVEVHGRGWRHRRGGPGGRRDVRVQRAGCGGWRPTFVPVYDYVLMTEPLTAGPARAIGWARPRGHVRRGQPVPLLPAVGGRPDPVGRLRRDLPPGQRASSPRYDARPATFDTLARHFVETFPQLDGIRFTHRWGGAIDTSTRFSVTFGDALGGRVHYALGYTGLGVGATRWAAGILRDAVLRPESDLLRLRFVRSRPFPIPPEPARTPAVEVMRRSVIAADAHEGRRGLFLQAMDALGIGFDS